jgi:hypothetical protein
MLGCKYSLCSRLGRVLITVPRGRKPAIVLAAVNGEALSGRLGDHP